MNRSAHPSRLVFLLVSALTTQGFGPIKEPAGPVRPNVILVMADDLGWGDTGYNGHPEIRTPHLDEMSRSGLRFDRFYAAAPTCSPTRGSCLTGRNPYRYGIPSANRGHLRASEWNLAEALGEAGYRTGHFGKWHLGTLTPDYSGKGAGRQPEVNHMTPGMAGFDEWFSTEYAVATWDPYGEPTETSSPRKRKEWPRDPRTLYWHNGVNLEGPLAGCDSKLIMDRALSFVRSSVASERPFLSVIWFHAPHAPVEGGPEYRARYEGHPENLQHYYAAVTALDAEVGRLRSTLRELGVERNTLVWFCSDNGPEGNPQATGRTQGSAGPFRGRKRSLYEGGLRVPGILEWPAAIDEPRTTTVPCVTSDYFPTILAAAGIEPSDKARPLDGVNLIPLITGVAEERERPIGFQAGNQATWVTQRFKLVHNTGQKRARSDNGTVPYAEFELYDLLADPGESRNLAAEFPERVTRMQRDLAAWQTSCQASAQER